MLLIITGQEAFGKRDVINALKGLLKEHWIVTSFFGISSFNVGGANLHRLLRLQVNGKNAERESIRPTPREIKECELYYH